MENYPNEAHTPYGGYRGAATAQPLEAPNSSPESYHPPSEGGYQQQEQLAADTTSCPSSAIMLKNGRIR